MANFYWSGERPILTPAVTRRWGTQTAEDLALAARIKAQGLGLLVMAADDLAETRMYRDLQDRSGKAS